MNPVRNSSGELSPASLVLRSESGAGIILNVTPLQSSGALFLTG